MKTEHLEQSYERDSRWKPHLSWSFLSWTLQQRMEEQAAQRELTWQKMADKLGPLLVADGQFAFGQCDYDGKETEERAQEKSPLISQKQQHIHRYIDVDVEAKYFEGHKRAKRRCLTVSGILISLIMLLFTIVILMALGVLHR